MTHEEYTEEYFLYIPNIIYILCI